MPDDFEYFSGKRLNRALNMLLARQSEVTEEVTEVISVLGIHLSLDFPCSFPVSCYCNYDYNNKKV